MLVRREHWHNDFVLHWFVFTNDSCGIALCMSNLYSQMIYVALHYACPVNCIRKLFM